MPHQWEAEQTIEPPVALQLVQEQFPKLGAKKIRLLGVGWDNTAFVIDEKFIFRFPRREIALPLLEAEWCLLPNWLLTYLYQSLFLSGEDPLPSNFPGLLSAIACWLVSLPAMQICPNKSAAKLQNLCTFPINPACNTFIYRLKCHIPGDNFSRIDKTQLIPKIRTNFEELELLGLLENRKQLEVMIEGAKDLRPPVSSTIVHGDFYVRHLLVDENHHLVGVIDWGDVHIGDPAIDLAIAHSFLPVDAHEKFKRAYGPIDEDTWRLAQLRALYSSTILSSSVITLAHPPLFEKTRC